MSKSSAGLIANPNSGKDIRRIISRASISDNNEKVTTIQRILLGLDAAGLQDVLVMPDEDALGTRALDGVTLNLHVHILDMEVTGRHQDTTIAVRRMVEEGCGVIIVLGGDGTNRAVAKACGRVPLLPVAYGTNNVFPSLVEGTVAGLAAGLVAAGHIPVEETTEECTFLEISEHSAYRDIALVDVAVSRTPFVGARAIWDFESLESLVMARPRPWHVGLSSIGGLLLSTPIGSRQALWVTIGQGGTIVRAPIAPGLIVDVPVLNQRVIEVGDSIQVGISAIGRTLALDGEREVELAPGQRASIKLSDGGPQVINVRKTLSLAAASGVFHAVRRE